MKKRMDRLTIARYRRWFGEELGGMWSQIYVPEDLSCLREGAVDDLDKIEALTRLHFDKEQGVERRLSNHEVAVLDRFEPDVMWVYFVCAVNMGMVKIGQSRRLAHRIREMQVGSPDKLVLGAAMKSVSGIEGVMHRQFADIRSHGEWFHVDEGLVSMMRLVRNKGLRGVAERIDTGELDIRAA